MAKVVNAKPRGFMIESIIAKDRIKDLTKDELTFINDEYNSGKYTPKEIWEMRDIRDGERNALQKKLVSLDDKVVMGLRLNKMKKEDDRYISGIELKLKNPGDPYGDIPFCRALRKGGDPREDIFCLSKEERNLLGHLDYGYTSEDHPELTFLDPFSDDNLPPNQSVVYYATYNSRGVPSMASPKFTARFYGEFEDGKFTAASLHKHKGTTRERKIAPNGVELIKEKQKITARNRKKIDPMYIEARKLRKKKATRNEADELKAKADSLNYLDGIELLDKPRALDDGTDTFRDTIALHDAEHSVALFTQETMIRDKKRPRAEKGRQFAIHNITGFQFPYNIEYVKYYTQGDDNTKTPKNFPLVVTAITKPVDELLDLNGCPTQPFRRWCTRIYKQEASIDFYRHFKMGGITQLLGISRFQSKDRAGKDPAVSMTGAPPAFLDRSKTVVVKNLAEADTLLKSASKRDEDEEGNPITYKLKKMGRDGKTNKPKYKIEWKIMNPDNRVYQSIPNFDWDEGAQKEDIKKYGIQISPVIKNFGMHGCMACPFRQADYYKKLREEFPDLYKMANKWRIEGGKTPEGNNYYYMYQPFKTVTRDGKKVKVRVSKEEAFDKKPQNFYKIDPDKPPTEDNLEPIF